MFYNPTTQKKTYNELIKLKSLKNDSLLYIKECLLKETIEECEIKLSDIKNKDFGKSLKRIERVTNLVKFDKEEAIKLSFNCVD